MARLSRRVTCNVYRFPFLSTSAYFQNTTRSLGCWLDAGFWRRRHYYRQPLSAVNLAVTNMLNHATFDARHSDSCCFGVCQLYIELRAKPAHKPFCSLQAYAVRYLTAYNRSCAEDSNTKYLQVNTRCCVHFITSLVLILPTMLSIPGQSHQPNLNNGANSRNAHGHKIFTRTISCKRDPIKPQSIIVKALKTKNGSY